MELVWAIATACSFLFSEIRAQECSAVNTTHLLRVDLEICT